MSDQPRRGELWWCELPEIGRHRFLTKPFSPREIVKAIQELLQEA